MNVPARWHLDCNVKICEKFLSSHFPVRWENAKMLLDSSYAPSPELRNRKWEFELGFPSLSSRFIAVWGKCCSSKRRRMICSSSTKENCDGTFANRLKTHQRWVTLNDYILMIFSTSSVLLALITQKFRRKDRKRKVSHAGEHIFEMFPRFPSRSTQNAKTFLREKGEWGTDEVYTWTTSSLRTWWKWIPSKALRTNSWGANIFERNERTSIVGKGKIFGLKTFAWNSVNIFKLMAVTKRQY